jgi:predicted amidohydrolase
VYSTDPANLFCQLYDTLPERLFAVEAEAEGWLGHHNVEEVASLVEDEVLQSGQLSGDSIERYVLGVTEIERATFAVLLGLDRAFSAVDLVTATYDESALVDLVLRYVETGRLSTADVEGALVPRIVSPAQEHLLPQSRREAFANVLRIGATPVPVEHVLLEPTHWFSRTLRDAGLYCGCLPAFDRDAPFTVARAEHLGRSCYRLRLEDPADSRRWITERLAELDDSGAQVGLLPEMALTPVLLQAWIETLREQPPLPGTSLRWIIIGSGPVDEAEQSPPHNRCVVLARAGGEVLWQQDKQYRFQLEPRLIERWGLVDHLDSETREEWITAGDHLVVVETPGVRAAIFVCEDLSEIMTLGVTAAEWGVSHALVPIFSQAIRRHRWEQRDASHLLQGAGTRSLVANSLWVGDADPTASGTPGDALAVSDQVRLCAANGPLDVMVFRFTEHGAFAITHEDLD